MLTYRLAATAVQAINYPGPAVDGVGREFKDRLYYRYSKQEARETLTTGRGRYSKCIVSRQTRPSADVHSLKFRYPPTLQVN